MTTSSILSLFGRFAGPFLVPVETTSAVVRGRGQGRPSGRRVSRLVLDAGKPGCTLVATKTTGKTPRAGRASVASIAAFSLFAQATPAASQEIDPPSSAPAPAPAVAGPSITQAVSEAARRFGLPEMWIYAVMRQESGGRSDAVSPKGAMGLLQLMPATWRELTLEFDLGSNPYDVRANVLAGSAYLRRLYDRFGSPGFLAAYNAGPERYAKHLASVQSLPLETHVYVQRLAPLVREADGPVQSAPAVDPRMAGLFLTPSWMNEASMDGTSVAAGGRGLWP